MVCVCREERVQDKGERGKAISNDSRLHSEAWTPVYRVAASSPKQAEERQSRQKPHAAQTTQDAQITGASCDSNTRGRRKGAKNVRNRPQHPGCTSQHVEESSAVHRSAGCSPAQHARGEAANPSSSPGTRSLSPYKVQPAITTKSMRRKRHSPGRDHLARATCCSHGRSATRQALDGREEAAVLWIPSRVYPAAVAALSSANTRQPAVSSTSWTGVRPRMPTTINRLDPTSQDGLPRHDGWSLTRPGRIPLSGRPSRGSWPSPGGQPSRGWHPSERRWFASPVRQIPSPNSTRGF